VSGVGEQVQQNCPYQMGFSLYLFIFPTDLKTRYLFLQFPHVFTVYPCKQRLRYRYTEPQITSILKCYETKLGFSEAYLQCVSF